MRILLASPFKQDPKVISGGINVWARNVLDYYHAQSGAIVLDAVSFDRFSDVIPGMNKWKRAINGAKDYIKAIRSTISYFRNNGKYDILHLCTSAQMGLWKDYIVIKIARWYGVKSILHLHFGRVPELATKNCFEWRLLKHVASLANGVIAIDPKSFHTLLDNGIQHAFYLPNPIASSIINQVKGYKGLIRRTPGKILFVGHVLKEKGVYELVQACVELPATEVHIIGTCEIEIKNSLLLIASKRDRGEWLKMRGSMDHEEVIREMLSCDLFVLPSYTEGFPNVILESMACGCAIISTPVGAIPEMLGEIEEKKCGVLIEPQSVDQLKTAIGELLIDDVLKEEYGTNAQIRINNYAMPIIWEQLVSIWSKASIS